MRKRTPEQFAAYKAHRKQVLVALPIWFFLFWATTYVHEYGHSVVCEAYGGQPEWEFDPLTYQALGVHCPGFQGNYLLVWSSGGLLAFTVCIIPAVVFRKYQFLLIAFLPNAVPHGINAVMETFAHGWYVNTPVIPHNLSTIPMLIVLGVLIMKPMLSILSSKKPV